MHQPCQPGCKSSKPLRLHAHYLLLVLVFTAVGTHAGCVCLTHGWRKVYQERPGWGNLGSDSLSFCKSPKFCRCLQHGTQCPGLPQATLVDPIPGSCMVLIDQAPWCPGCHSLAVPNARGRMYGIPLTGWMSGSSLHETQCNPVMVIYVMNMSCALSRFSCVWLFVTLWTAAHQAPLSVGFSRQEYWSGLPCPPPGFLSDPGFEPTSLMPPALAGRFFTAGATWEAHN